MESSKTVQCFSSNVFISFRSPSTSNTLPLTLTTVNPDSVLCFHISESPRSNGHDFTTTLMLLINRSIHPFVSNIKTRFAPIKKSLLCDIHHREPLQGCGTLRLRRVAQEQLTQVICFFLFRPSLRDNRAYRVRPARCLEGGGPLHFLLSHRHTCNVSSLSGWRSAWIDF